MSSFVKKKKKYKVQPAPVTAPLLQIFNYAPVLAGQQTVQCLVHPFSPWFPIQNNNGKLYLDVFCVFFAEIKIWKILFVFFNIYFNDFFFRSSIFVTYNESILQSWKFDFFLIFSMCS